MHSDARFFLEALFADKPEGQYILLWTLPEKQSHWFRDLPDAIRFAESRHDLNLYVALELLVHRLAHLLQLLFIFRLNGRQPNRACSSRQRPWTRTSPTGNGHPRLWAMRPPRGSSGVF
jgi:hypothetical protein